MIIQSSRNNMKKVFLILSLMIFLFGIGNTFVQTCPYPGPGPYPDPRWHPDPTFIFKTIRSVDPNFKKTHINVKNGSEINLYALFDRNLIQASAEIVVLSSTPAWMTLSGFNDNEMSGGQDLKAVKLKMSIAPGTPPNSYAEIKLKLQESGSTNTKALKTICVAVDKTLTAEIFLPYMDSLVRADIPIFGNASGDGFANYKVKYGKGCDPSVWTEILTSSDEQKNDNSLIVTKNGSSAIKGNLATWRTGLKTYNYESQPVDLNGKYTVRLEVSDISGHTIADDVVLQVGEVITSSIGGIIESPDTKIRMEIPSMAQNEDYRLAAIDEIDPYIQYPFSTKISNAFLVGNIYEIRPMDLVFTSDITFKTKYSASNLDLNNDGIKDLDEESLCLFIWSAEYGKFISLFTALDKVQKELTAIYPKSSVVPSYICVASLLSPPGAPRLAQPASPSFSKMISLSGSSRPGTKVRIYIDHVLYSETSPLPASGLFSENVLLQAGINVITAISLDEKGNSSVESAPANVNLIIHNPLNIASVRFMDGSYSSELDQDVGPGEKLHLELQGEDAYSDSVDSTSVHIYSSLTDPDGIAVDLLETGKNTGIFHGEVTLGSMSIEKKQQLGAGKNNETIAVYSIIDSSKSDNVHVTDHISPEMPVISSSTHPSVAQDYFESGFGEWANRGGESGALLIKDNSTFAAGRNSLKLVNEQSVGTFGVFIRSSSFDAGQYKIVSFDYKIASGIKTDIMLLVNGKWLTVGFTDDSHYSWSGVTTIGKLPINADDNWHHLEFNLYELLKNNNPSTSNFVVDQMIMANVDDVGCSGVKEGSNPAGASYHIDNFMILKSCTNNSPVFQWEKPVDTSGIAGYKFAFDNNISTDPDNQMDATNTSISFHDVQDGNWYFHLKSVDSAGNWSETANYKIIVDKQQIAAPTQLEANGKAISNGFSFDIYNQLKATADNNITDPLIDKVRFEFKRSESSNWKVIGIDTDCQDTDYLAVLDFDDPDNILGLESDQYDVRAVSIDKEGKESYLTFHNCHINLRPTSTVNGILLSDSFENRENVIKKGGVVNNNPSFLPGKSGNGVELDAYQKNIEYPVYNNIDKKNGSIQMWVKPNWSSGDPGQNHIFLFVPGTDGAKNEIILFKWDGSTKIHFKITGENGIPNEVSKDVSGWAANEWHFITATWSGSEIKLYLDQEAPVSGVITDKPGNLSQNIFIGSFADGTGSVNAMIDELKIYNKEIGPIFDSITSSGTVPLTWGPTDGTTDIAKYKIEFIDQNVANPIWTKWIETNSLQGSFSGLNHHTYSFRSVAVDSYGNNENKSNSLDDFTTTIVTPPQFVQAAYNKLTGHLAVQFDRTMDITPSLLVHPEKIVLKSRKGDCAISASSMENDQVSPYNVVDGNLSTRWSSLHSNPQWISVDLGQSYLINKVRLLWETAYGKSYKIETSLNNTNWSEVYSTASGDGGEDVIEFSAVSARYVRMFGTERGTEWGYSLWEFEVYKVPNLAMNKRTTASSSENDQVGPDKAVDGDVGTRWSSEHSDPQWISIDLGDSYSINKVRLLWETAYGKSYKIETSLNNTNWLEVYSTASGDGGEDVIEFSAVSARYVRMFGTERGTEWGYSLWEFEVYGSVANQNIAYFSKTDLSNASVVEADSSQLDMTLTAQQTNIVNSISRQGSNIELEILADAVQDLDNVKNGAITDKDVNIFSTSILPDTAVFSLAGNNIDSSDIPLVVRSVNGSTNLALYSIQVLDENSNPTAWQEWIHESTDTNFIFSGLDNHTYRFRSIAKDRTGSIETNCTAAGDCSVTITLSPKIVNCIYNSANRTINFKFTEPLDLVSLPGVNLSKIVLKKSDNSQSMDLSGSSYSRNNSSFLIITLTQDQKSFLDSNLDAVVDCVSNSVKDLTGVPNKNQPNIPLTRKSDKEFPQSAVYNTAYYTRFENMEEVADSGAQIAGNIGFVSGKYGNAGLFDSGDKYLKYPVNGKMSPSEGTVDLWINPSWTSGDMGADRAIFHIPGTSGYANEMTLFKWAGSRNLYWKIYNHDGTDYKEIFYDVSGWRPGEWYNVTVSWGNSSQMKLFIDGKLVANRNDVELPKTLSGTAYFGVMDEDEGFPINAALDEIRIYNKQISPLQISLFERMETKAWIEGDGGTVYGNPAFFQGKNGQAVEIKNSGEGVGFSTAGIVDSQKGKVDFWVKPDWDGTETGSDHILFQIPGTSGSANEMRLWKWADKNNLYWKIFNNQGTEFKEIPCDISSWRAGEWHHIEAGWGNSDEMYLNVDNQFYQKLTGVELPDQLDSQFTIGSAKDGATGQFNGQLDEFVVYQNYEESIIEKTNQTRSIPIVWGPEKGSDDINFYDIQVRTADQSWTDWLKDTTATSGVYEGQNNETYCFRTISRDYSGNQEINKSELGDLKITVKAGPKLTDCVYNSAQKNLVIRFDETLNLSSASNSLLNGITIKNRSAEGVANTSSVQDASLTVLNAFDGDEGTRWSSAFADPQWISIDLGAIKTVNKVILNWEAAYGKSYRVETSLDNANWTTVYSTTSGQGGNETNTFPSVPARYVRMFGTERGTQFGYSLYEFQVYENDQNLSLAKEINFSGADFLKENNSYLKISVTPSQADQLSLFGSSMLCSIMGNSVANQDGRGNDPSIDSPVSVLEDATLPESSVRSLPAVSLSKKINLAWGPDAGTSDISSYNIDVYDENASTPSWEVWQAGTVQTNAQFIGLQNHTYRFRSRALDQAGNLETAYSDSGDTSTTIHAGPEIVSAMYNKGSGNVKLVFDAPVNASFPDGINPGNIIVKNRTGTNQIISSSVINNNTPNYAFDGNLNTRWESQWSDPQSISVDLGNSYYINKIKLFWENAFGKSYKIETSVDSGNWTEVYSTTTGTGSENIIDIAPSAARYVKLTGIERGTQWGYSLWEFEVYSIDDPSKNLAFTKPVVLSGSTFDSVDSKNLILHVPSDATNQINSFNGTMFLDLRANAVSSLDHYPNQTTVNIPMQFSDDSTLPKSSVNNMLLLESFESSAKIGEKNGTVHGNSDFIQAKSGNGVNLDSAEKYITYPTADNIDKDSGTIGFWIKPSWVNGDPGQSHLLFHIPGTAETVNEMILFKWDGDTKLHWKIVNNDNNATEISYDVSPWSPGAWHYIAVSWGNKLSMYVDNQLVGQADLNSKASRLSDTFYVGESWAAPSAVLDELFVSSQELPPPFGLYVNSADIPVRWALKQGTADAAYYDIEVQNSGVSTNWNIWLLNTTENQALYTGIASQNYRFRSIAYDVNGNKETEYFSDGDYSVTIDTVPPAIDFSINGGQTFDGQKYIISPASTISLNSTDTESGLKSLQYRINGNSFQDYSSPIVSFNSGSNLITVQAIDFAGNQNVVSYQVFVDNGAPYITIAPQDKIYNNGINSFLHANTSYTLTAHDASSGAGDIIYRYNDTGYSSTPSPAAIDTDGKEYILAKATDKVGNESLEQVFSIDAVPPSTLLSATPFFYTGGINNISDIHTFSGSGTVLSLSAIDALTGVKQTFASLDHAGFIPYQNAFTAGQPGTHLLQFYSIDYMDNSETVQSNLYVVDATTPVTSDNYSFTSTPLSASNNDWSHQDALITLNPVDPLFEGAASGISKTISVISNEAVITNSGIQLPAISYEGITKVYYFSVDNVGNAEASVKSLVVKIDKTSPNISISGVAENGRYNVSVIPVITVNELHPQFTTITLNGHAFASGTTVSADGNYILSVISADLAGNSSQSSVAFTIDRTVPDVPTGLAGLLQNTNVYLSWQTVTNQDLAGYNVFRNGIKMNAVLVQNTSFSDIKPAFGTYSYTVSAVDTLGNESVQSVPFTIIVGDVLQIVAPVDEGFYCGKIRISALIKDHHAKGEWIEAGEGRFPSQWTLLHKNENRHFGHGADRITYIWDTDHLNGGMTIRVRTKKDNQWISSSVYVSIDNTKPITKINLSPQPPLLEGEGAGNITNIPLGSSVSFDASDSVVNNVSAGVKYTKYRIRYNERDQHHGFNRPDDCESDYDFIVWNGQPIILTQPGFYEVKYFSMDNAVDQQHSGNVENVHVKHLYIPGVSPVDNIPPVITISNVQNNGVYNSTVTPVIAVSDLALDESKTHIQLNGYPYISGIPVSAPGLYRLLVSAEDRSGNRSHADLMFTINPPHPVDITKPVIRISDVEPGKYYNSAVAPRIIITDDTPTGLTSILLLNGQTYVSETPVTADSNYLLSVTALDFSGNMSSTNVRFVVDTTLPNISISGVNNNCYYKTPVAANVTVNDKNPGTSSVSLDGSPYVNGTLIPQEADHNLTARAVDKAENAAIYAVRFTVDKTAPLINITGVAEGLTYPEAAAVITVQDTNLDPAKTLVTLNGNPYISGTLIKSNSRYELFAHAEDKAANAAEKRVHFNIHKVNATNTLLFSANYDTSGQADFALGNKNVIDGGQITSGDKGRLSGEALSENGRGAAYSSSSNINATNGTVMMWIKPSWTSTGSVSVDPAHGSADEDRPSAGNQGRYLFSLKEDHDNSMGNYNMNLVVFENKGTVLQIKDKVGNYYEFAVDKGPEAGRWYKDKDWTHLTWSWNARTGGSSADPGHGCPDLDRPGTGLIKIWLNGNLAGAFTNRSWMPNVKSDLWIGNRSNDESRKSGCRIDDVRIFSRELSPAEILQQSQLVQLSDLNGNGVVAYLEKGNKYYTDRDYVVTNMPVDFRGSAFIQTANNDKQFAANRTYLSFKVLEDADIFVAFDERVNPKPRWLTDDYAPWLVNGVQQKFSTTDTGIAYLKLYKRSCVKNAVINTGGNAGQSENTSNYILIIKRK